MCLVDYHQIERLGGQLRVVGDGDWRGGDVIVQAWVVTRGDLVALKHLVDALDRGDHDVAAAEHARAGELVDVVDLGETTPIAGRPVVLELRQGLVGEVVAVD